MKQIEEASKNYFLIGCIEKQAEEAQRDDCTVLVSRINIMANERDVYNYFAKAGVGKIRDVRLIRDQRSGKSKGYVVNQLLFVRLSLVNYLNDQEFSFNLIGSLM